MLFCLLVYGFIVLFIEKWKVFKIKFVIFCDELVKMIIVGVYKIKKIKIDVINFVNIKILIDLIF